MAGLQQVVVQAQKEAESTWASSEPTDVNTLSSKDDAADSSSFAATNVGEPQVDSLFDQAPPSSLQVTTTIWYSLVTQMRAPRIATPATPNLSKMQYLQTQTWERQWLRYDRN